MGAFAQGAVSWPPVFYGHAQPRPGPKTTGLSIDLLTIFYLQDPEITTSVSYILKIYMIII